jgi:alcohol-forming fatty acyl-CoA reductase
MSPGHKTAAFFDVDGTLCKSNIVHHYFYLARQDQSSWQQLQTTMRLLSLIPAYLWLDGVSRDAFNHVFYANYGGLAVEQCRKLGQRYFQQKLRANLFPAALAQIAQHQRQGRQIVLVTGSIDCIIAPLADFLKADAGLTTQLETVGEHYTGYLQGPPVADQEKARLIQKYATQTGIDLTQSYAYGDSIADLPMLQAIGHPVAVNPDKALRQLATQARWPIYDWTQFDSAQPVLTSPEPCL